jgi:hypothetical protein
MLKALRYYLEGHGFETEWGEWILLIYLIFLAALGARVYSVFNIN